MPYPYVIPVVLRERPDVTYLLHPALSTRDGKEKPCR